MVFIIIFYFILFLVICDMTVLIHVDINLYCNNHDLLGFLIVIFHVLCVAIFLDFYFCFYACRSFVLFIFFLFFIIMWELYKFKDHEIQYANNKLVFKKSLSLFNSFCLCFNWFSNFLSIRLLFQCKIRKFISCWVILSLYELQLFWGEEF